MPDVVGQLDGVALKFPNSTVSINDRNFSRFVTFLSVLKPSFRKKTSSDCNGT
jgi:hypothetical protein